VSEIERRQLHKEVENIMSDDSAAVLMRLLPPVGWNDFATKQDLETLGKFMQLGFNNSLLELRNDMNTEFASLRKEMHTELATVRSEMHTEFGTVRSEMNIEFAAIRSDLHHEIDGLRKEIYTEFAAIRSELRHEVDGMRKEMNEGFLDLRKEMNAGFLDLRKEMNNQTHRMFMAMLGINTLLMSVAIAAFKLL
jgi:DNA anti-recombination protein RmuC